MQKDSFIYKGYYYEYSKEDVRKIFTAIENELKAAKAKFDSSSDDSIKFKLK